MHHVMIGGERAVEITPIPRLNADGERVITLGFTDVAAILDEWLSLRPGRRDYRYGNDADDTEPAKIIIAQATVSAYGTPILLLEELDPSWDATDSYNEYELEALDVAMGYDLEWGTAIGEEEL